MRTTTAHSMKLVFLYGPPAVGKLTVARALSKLTGFKVFHNHLTIDVVQSVFDWGEGPFWDLVGRFRIDVMEAAAKVRHPGLIFTFVYSRLEDDGFVRRVVAAVEQNGGEVCFVRLYCSRQELFRRLRLPSRRAFRKMKKVKSLKALLSEHDLLSDVPFVRNLAIDNTRLPAARVARMIKFHFRL